MTTAAPNSKIAAINIQRMKLPKIAGKKASDQRDALRAATHFQSTKRQNGGNVTQLTTNSLK
jgi:hypothetical protein